MNKYYKLLTATVDLDIARSNLSYFDNWEGSTITFKELCVGLFAHVLRESGGFDEVLHCAALIKQRSVAKAASFLAVVILARTDGLWVESIPSTRDVLECIPLARKLLNGKAVIVKDDCGAILRWGA